MSGTEILNPFTPETGTTGQKIDPNGVNHPSHYNSHPSGVECITIVRHMNFNCGNAVKYLWRAGLKDGQSSLKDLEKAEFYIKDEIERVRKLGITK